MALFITGVVSLALRVLPPAPIKAMYSAMLLSLALVHFYLDGLFWAFKRAEVRASLGPYLMGMRPGGSVKAA